MTPRTPARRGFTLIELLVVIAIILILVALSFGLFRAASNARSKAVARGSIQAMAMASETYKKTYGDYPCAPAGTAVTDGQGFRRALFDQLSGRKVLRQAPVAAGGVSIALVNFNDASLPGGSTRRPKPFLSSGEVETSNDAASGDVSVPIHFMDPWGNPYDYRYRILPASGTAVQNPTTGVFATPYVNWKVSGFLIVSCGANYIEPATGAEPAANEYWDTSGSPSMTTSGIVPSTYFEDTSSGPYRADNVTNWAGN
jgi:prepilin-type N-terminal cleavage/methylation domain-containing protein